MPTETIAALPSGTPIRIRPIQAEDATLLIDLAAHMTPEDLRLRFFTPIHRLSPEAAARLARIEAREMALVAQPLDREDILGVARFAADAISGEAEFAVAVRSDWKGRGIGWILMEKLVEAARQRGIVKLTGLVLRGNNRMLRFCRDFGFTISDNPDDPLTLEVSLLLR